MRLSCLPQGLIGVAVACALELVHAAEPLTLERTLALAVEAHPRLRAAESLEQKR
jgi:hypothetical protein